MIEIKNKAELEFERDLIDALSHGALTQPGQTLDDVDRIYRTRNWEYMPSIKTEEDLWANFKKILEQHNAATLDQPLSYVEFAQVKREINELSTPFKAGQFLYGLNGTSQVEVDLDDGRHVFLTVFDQSQVGAGDTVYQVVNQIQRPAVIPGRPDRRFDVTLLINGLPIIQIELKRSGLDVNQALNQMHQYAREGLYQGIFSTVQLLVGMTPNDAVYMANTPADQFNKDFSFHWQTQKDNTIVRNWRKFADHVLSIPAAHELSTSYMILDGTPNRESIKVMRPYQVHATRKALNAIKHRDYEAAINRLGYIWHTTGSGKTITSFKTAWLASKLPLVDKVVFLVDRKQLTNQTLSKYRAYDPEAKDIDSSVIGDTENTRQLHLKLKDNAHKIIVTSVQKMDRLVKRSSFKDPGKNIVFIVDEAHRSTSGDSFANIQKAFKHGAWLGYTGTPVFEPNSNQPKTVDLFGKCLHSYTIKEAIADKSVLGFHVDFKTTIPEDQVQEKYLPEFYRRQHPEWTKEQISEKIANLTSRDFEDETASFYDENEKHVQAVVKDIVENWDARSNNRKYNALLTTHVGGNAASSPMALMYYNEFKKWNKILEKQGKEPLKVALTYTMDASNKEFMEEVNTGLESAIDDYNELFDTHHSLKELSAYRNDLEERLGKTSTDKNYLDLVIVVDQLLTGFDAPQLNTLYVDRSLRGANLVQAYSRTNRMENLVTKPFGNIINYRWPKKTEEEMNRALTMYTNKKYAAQGIDPTHIPADTPPKDVVVEPIADLANEAREVTNKLARLTKGCTQIPASEKECFDMLDLLKKFNADLNKLKQYSSEEIDTIAPGVTEDGVELSEMDRILEYLGITADDAQTLVGPLKRELMDKIRTLVGGNDIEMDLALIQFKEVQVNYDYLTELLESLINATHDDETTIVDETLEKLSEFVKGLDDPDFASDIMRTVELIRKKEFPLPDSNMQYPYRVEDSRELIQLGGNTSKDKDMEAFIEEWGIQGVITPEQLRKLISRHVYGQDDLNDGNVVTEVLKGAASQYTKKAGNPLIRDLKKIAYRNRLRMAITQLADKFVQ